jgi:O-antigen ligase
MKIKKKVFLWLLLVIPFFYPNSIAGTLMATIWHQWKIVAVLMCGVYIFQNFKRLKYLEKVTWVIILFYIMQIIATRINKIDITYDLKTAIMMSCFVIVISLIVYKEGNEGILFFYQLLHMLVWLNFASVILFYGEGIVRDSYDTAVYFWSTKNHIISITLAYLVIAYYIFNEGYIVKRKYWMGVIASIVAVFLMGSSTAIAALFVYGVFIFCCNICGKKGRIVNMKMAVVIGILADIAIVVFRIQERLGGIISKVFGKDTTLTGRTDLWDQALELVGINTWFGKGNSYALNQYGWLTKQYWNSGTQTLEDVYFVSHNQFLEIMVNGGLICLIPFIGIFYWLIQSAKRIQNSKYKMIIGAALIAYFIAMITDLITPYEPVYLFIIVASYIYKCENTNAGGI